MQKVKSHQRSVSKKGKYERSMYSSVQSLPSPTETLSPSLQKSPSGVSHMTLQKSIQEVRDSMTHPDAVRSFTEEKINEGYGVSPTKIKLHNRHANVVYMDRISALELPINNAVHVVSERSTDLSNHNPTSSRYSEPDNEKTIVKYSDVDYCWSWIQQVTRLAQMHITYAAEYHKFHFEISEVRTNLDQTNSLIFSDLSETNKNNQGSIPFECRRLSQCMKEHLSKLMTNYQRIDGLLQRSKDVHPIHLRLPGSLTSKRFGAKDTVAVCLCRYKASESSVVSLDEEVVVIDNSDKNAWRIRTRAGVEMDIPAICLAIISPDSDATETAIKLKNEMLSKWMNAIEGYQQHSFNLFVCFFEYLISGKYSVQSGKAEQSLSAFVNELELDFLSNINDNDAATLANLMSEIRAKMNLSTSSGVHRPSSIGSVSSLPSIDPIQSFKSSTDSININSQSTRCLRDAEVQQQRILLKVLKEHMTMYQHNSVINPLVVVTCDSGNNSANMDVPLSASSSNVFVFPNQTDVDKLTSRTRLDSTSSNLTNAEIQQYMMRNGPSTHKFPPPSTPATPQSPQTQLTSFHVMIDQPTIIERSVVQSECLISKPLTACLPTQNHVTSKKFNFGIDNGPIVVTKFEASKSSNPISSPVTTKETGASWIEQKVVPKHILCQTPWDLKEKVASKDDTTQTFATPIMNSRSELVKETQNVQTEATVAKVEMKTNFVKQTFLGQSSNVKTRDAIVNETSANYVTLTSTVSTACTQEEPKIKNKPVSSTQIHEEKLTKNVFMRSQLPILRSVGASKSTKEYSNIGGQFGTTQVEKTIGTEKETQANFELEIVSKVLIRNHNLEDFELVSMEKQVVYENAVESMSERLQTRSSGLQVNKTTTKSTFTH